MTNLTIFTDFDGVIRHWDNSEILRLEREVGLPEGTTFTAVFDQSLTQAAITGEISHQRWVQEARTLLRPSTRHADDLIDAWVESPSSIDHEVLALYHSFAPQQLVLVTNATDRLNHDLHHHRLKFDVVVNASTIRVAKPNAGFYEKALALAQVPNDQVVFIDDRSENVEMAQKLGMRAHLFDTVPNLKRFLADTMSAV